MRLHSATKQVQPFVSSGLKAVSMLLRLERYFVFIAVNVENADSHRYVEANGRSAVTAESDNDGYSALMLSQKASENSSRSLESEDRSASSS